MDIELPKLPDVFDNTQNVDTEMKMPIKSKIDNEISENKKIEMEEQLLELDDLNDITTDEIKLFLNNQKNIVYNNDETKQSIEEFNMINTELYMCSQNSPVYTFDTQFIKDLLYDQFFNYDALNYVRCLLKRLLLFEVEDLPLNILIRKYFKDLTKIGVKSVYGDVYHTIFNKMIDLIVFKTKSIYNSDEENSVHELFIGLILNALKKDIPNFVFTYGAINCSIPIDPNSSIFTYCKNSEEQSLYIMLENINSSITLRNYIKSGCNLQEFLNVFMQILYSLHHANKNYDFTHYDLHSANVLIRKYNNYFAIKYETEYGIEYLKTNILATIIDYGFSHIYYKNKHYGVYNSKNIGVYHNSSYYMFDVYKLLGFCLYDALEYNKILYDEIIKLFRFFNKSDNLTDAIKIQKKYRYLLPPLKGFPDMKILKFTEFVTHTFSLNFMFEKIDLDVPIINCSTNPSLCINETQLEQSSNINQYQPYDFIELLHMIKTMNLADFKDQLESIQIIYNNLEPTQLAELENYANTSVTQINTLSEFKIDIIFSTEYEYIYKFKNYLFAMIQTSDTIDQYKNNYSVYSILNKILFENNSKIKNPSDALLNLFKDYTKLKLNLMNSLRIIINNPDFVRLNEEQLEAYNFYKKELLNYTGLL